MCSMCEERKSNHLTDCSHCCLSGSYILRISWERKKYRHSKEYHNFHTKSVEPFWILIFFSLLVLCLSYIYIDETERILRSLSIEQKRISIWSTSACIVKCYNCMCVCVYFSRVMLANHDFELKQCA